MGFDGAEGVLQVSHDIDEVGFGRGFGVGDGCVKVGEEFFGKGAWGGGGWFVCGGVCVGIDSDKFDVGLGILCYRKCVDASSHG